MTDPSLRQRYESARPTYTRVNAKRFADLEPGTTVLIASPGDIEAEINRLPRGELFTQRDLRRRLADRHGADGACPAMTGMNLRVVAELVLAGLDAGMPSDAVTPVWLVIDPDSALATRLPGGPDRIRSLRHRAP